MLPRETRGSSMSFLSCRSGARGGMHTSSATQDFLESLSHAEECVMAAWTRIGLAELDRHNKWSGFVERRLLPFLQDYARMQVSEEVAIAAENDRLFREVFFASLRLKEPPRSKELARLVEAVMDQSASQPLSTTGQQQPGRSGAYGWCNELAESSCLREDVYSSDQVHPQLLLLEREAGELGGSFTLPSFVTVATAPGNDDRDSFNAFFASRVREYQQHQQEEPQATNLSEPFPVAMPAQNSAWAALWQLARSMTHQELHRNLEDEVQRMNSLADARLQQLCLLYKQRALLQLSPQEQASMRAKYAEKLIIRGYDKPVSHQQQHQPSFSSSSLACGHANACCSGSSAVTPGPSSGRTTINSNNTCRSCHSVVKGELDLLSESIPERLCADLDCPSLLHPNRDDSSVTVPQEELSGRETIFEVDVGDIMRFGRRQDLSLARIDAETQGILAEIVAQNERMGFHAEEELRCVEELWNLLEGSAVDVEEGGHVVQRDVNCRKEDLELPSRQEFMYHLMRMQQEYERQDVAEESAACTAEGEPYIERVATNNSSSGVTSHRTTCSSRSRVLSHPRVPLLLDDGSGGSGAVGVGGVNGTSTAELPAPLIRLLTARSYAPILAYIVTVRGRLQRLVLQRHVEVAQAITTQLTEMHQRYFAKTRDPAYHVTPDYSQWLKENAIVAAESGRTLSHSGCVGEAGIWQQFLTEFTPRNSNDGLRERISEVQYVVNRAKVELHLLSRRLQIIDETEPLVQRRQEILEQLRTIEEGSRERLLSKKPNMAKQLLFEEETRRRFARELPKIIDQMKELLKRWDETACGGGGDGGCDSNSRRLVVRGVSIADLVREFHNDAARVVASRRPLTSFPRGGSNDKSSHSPPPLPPLSSSQNAMGFATPRAARIPRSGAASASPVPRSVASGKKTTDVVSTTNNHNAVTARMPVRSSSVSARLHSAKKSVSPAPVKRGALRTQRPGASGTPPPKETSTR